MSYINFQKNSPDFPKARILSISMVIVAVASLAQAATPNIASAVVDSDANTLTITGTNLLGPDGNNGISGVTLGNTSLIVTGSPTPSLITTTFPAGTPAFSFAPGTYPLTVAFIPPPYYPTTKAFFTMVIGVQTRLLFALVTSQVGYDTVLYIANVSLDPSTGAAGSAGTCTLHFPGSSSPTFTTGTVAPGGTLTILLSSAASGFFGYATAHCNFKAQGRALGLQGLNFIWNDPAIVNP